ncbi:MAG: ATP-binding protein [Pseudobutyrivibrio sp.]|nr:ATP-binding protein [Pseudobutyrivibrio sp.]
MKKTVEFDAKIENLNEVLSFVEGELEALNCSTKEQIQITVSVEEIFVNIAHYAYGQLDSDGNPKPDTGTGPMWLTISGDSGKVSLVFEDKGFPYNPLLKPDPDITLSVEDRNIGGLGIFMVKKSMDDVSYEYKEGKNILTLEKCF